MASKFNLTAELNLRGPSNLKTVVAGIRRELSNVKVDVNVAVAKNAGRNIDNITNRLNTLNASLVQARTSTDQLNASFGQLASIARSIDTINTKSAQSTKQHAESITSTAKAASVASSKVEEFGKQSALAIKRFAAFSFPTVTFFALGRAVQSGIESFIAFDKQMVKLEQITGNTKTQLKSLSGEITRLSTTMGVSSIELAKVAETLAQAGFSARDTTKALEALAKTDLAPSFDNLTQTTEGAIAAMRQFGLEAKDLEKALGSINAVSAAFAVESGDIIAAIQRTGGVFASTSRGVSEGTDALNEFVAVFTSVRATTRESAETIATGLRTIFTRIQRAGTISQLKEYGIQLQDLEGKFVGPYEAVRRLSEGLKSLDPRDVRFSSIIEELGGFRQIGKVLPLIQQFATAQDALKVAQRGQNSLTDAQIKAQNSLANQFAKVREQFLALMRDIGSSTAFQGLATLVIGLSKGLIGLVSAFKPVLPILTVVAGIKAISGIGSFTKGFLGGGKKETKPSLFASAATEDPKEKITREKNEATARAAEALRINTDAINKLTSAVTSLDSTIKSRPASTLKDGGKVLRFNRGGVVPGVGTRDSVPALLTPKERVLTRSQNKRYEKGGPVSINELEKTKGAKDTVRSLKSSKPREVQDYDKLLSSNLIRKTITETDLAEYYRKKDNSKYRTSNTNKPISPKEQRLANTRFAQDINQTSNIYEGPRLSAQGLAFEDFVASYVAGVEGISGYRKTKKGSSLDLLGKGLAPIEVKFTSTKTPDEIPIGKKLSSRSKLLKDRFTTGQDELDVGAIKLYEIDPNLKERMLQSSLLRKASGGKIRGFANGGYIDYDLIAQKVDQDKEAAGLKKAPIGAKTLADSLIAEAVLLRQEGKISKLRTVYGVAGRGKSRLLAGSGKPITSLEDLAGLDEISVASSNVSLGKLKGYMRASDQIDVLSSSTQAEQELVRQQRASRDAGGAGLFGRTPGVTKNISTDSAVEEALLMREFGNKVNILTEDRQGGLRRKTGNELVDFETKKLGIFAGNFGPTTFGHESTIDIAKREKDIDPENLIVLPAGKLPLDVDKPDTHRTLVFTPEFKLAMAKAGFGARGAKVLSADLGIGGATVPLGFAINTAKEAEEAGVRRKIVLSGQGSTAFTADKEEKALTKYRNAGYDVINSKRTKDTTGEEISGTRVRELIDAGDIGGLSATVSPGVLALIEQNKEQIQNRIRIIPELIAKARALYGDEYAAAEAEFKANRGNSEPFKEKRDALKKALNKYPGILMAQLEQEDPARYALNSTLDPSRILPSIEKQVLAGTLSPRDIATRAATASSSVLASVQQQAIATSAAGKTISVAASTVPAPATNTKLRTAQELFSGPYPNIGTKEEKSSNRALWDQDLVGTITEEGLTYSRGMVGLSDGRSVAFGKAMNSNINKTYATEDKKKLDAIRQKLSDKYNAVKAEADKKGTSGQIQQAKAQGLRFAAVGMFGTPYLDQILDVNDGKGNIVQAILSGYLMDQALAKQWEESFSRGANVAIAGALGNSGSQVGTAVLPGASAVTQGNLFQDALHARGAPPASKGSASMDFPVGLQGAAALFAGLDPTVPTDAKRTLRGPADIRSNIENFLKGKIIGQAKDEQKKKLAVVLRSQGRDADVERIVGPGYANGGIVQKFPIGGKVEAKKNRTKKGSTGARNQFAEISDKYIEDFTKWASDIQREYDNDPSLPLTSYNGLRMPPEIAYAYSLFSKQAFETGGAGLSVGKKFVPHTGDMSKDLQKYILEENPNNPGEYGFFEDIIAKFGRSKQERALIRKQRKDALRGSKTNDGRNALGLTGILRATPEMVAGRALKQTMLEQAIQVPKTEQSKQTKSSLKASDRFITRFNAMAKNSDFSGLDQSELGGYIAHLKSKNPDIMGSFESYKGMLEGTAIARATRGIEQFKRYEAGLGPTIENSSHAKDFGWLVSQALEGAKEFNEGGIAELSNIPIRSATNIENSLGQIGSEDELLKKLIQKKKNKTIGYSYILGEGALESGYFSDINKALGFSGAGGGVQASKRGGYHETTLSNAIQGFGPYLYEILMEQISSMGSKMMPDRRSVSPQALGVWKKFYNRSSIEKYDLPSKFQYLGETDSLGMNDIDVLNTAYSKTPQFINYPDVVNYSNIKTKDNQTLALMEEVFPENSTIFKNNGGVVRFASGGQAVNSVGADIAKEFNLVQGNTTAFNQLENNCLAIAREVASRFGYENNEDKIRGQLDTFQKLRASKSGPFGIKPTPELLAKSKSISRMYNDPTSAASSGNIIVRESDELMKHVSFEHKNKEYNFGAAGKDWPIILRIPLKKKMEELYSGGIAQFATGGQNKSIRARVSTGELFVPDKTVRSIPGGYKTMEKANHADKNGFSGFSTGGITQFKGPGTGTSDSIETNLSPGFVIRAKAAKAMGYSKGGIVGYKRGGATGGQPIDFSVTLNVDSIKHLTFAIQQLVSTTTDLDEIDRLSNLINDIKNGSINASDAITELKTSTENLAKSGDLVAASLGDRLVKVVSKFEKQEQSKQLASIIPNEKLTQERKSYLEFKSNERGQSVKQFQREEAGKVITRAREIASERNAVGTNLELLATSQRDKLSGLNKAVGAGGKTGISAILEDGTTNANFAQANAAVEQFAAQIQRANPEIAYGDAREAAIKMAEALSENKTASEATGSVLTSFGDKLTKVRDDGLDSLDQAANNLGISLRDLGGKAGQAIKEQSFIQSREGKRFGALAELAPGALQKFSQTGLGRGLGAGADFIEGKGGRLSRGFSRLGGFTGIGAGLVAGSETIKGFLPKDVTSDPNVAGAFGAATGAGVGAATGAQLGSFAGPIGTLIGGVGGALIGGIKGFFDAQNQAILTNAFEKLARSTGDLDEAFKKLDAEFTSLNFSKAQGAFGDVLSTQSEIRDIAFGNENQDNVAAGTGVGASIGAITGGIIGSFGGPVGTAIGAAIGGAIGGEIGFLASTKSPEQRQEALNATIQNAGSNIDTTGRLADKQLQNVTSIKELEKAYENAKNGTNELGPIVEQYAVGIAGSKNKITEQIAAQAKERAAIDAYIKKRKESGATDEQIGKELKTNPKGAIKEGLAAIKVNEELRIKQALLVRSTKEVEIASVKLIDIYRRVGAFAQRYSDELGDISTDIAGYIGDLTGNSEIQNTDRRNERVLGNISAFSGEEVKAAAQQVAAISGNTEGAQQLADQAIIAKTLTDKLPALLNTTNDKGEIEKTLRGVFEDQGVGEESIKAILGEIGTVIDNSEASDSKTLFSEIEEKGVIGKVSAAAEAGLKAMGEIAKQYNDTLDTYSKLANQRNQILIKANNFFRQAEQIRLKSELELAQALGKTLSLDQLNKPFETEVKSLTSGLVQGGTLDPEEIFQGISRLAKENKDIERINKENKGLFNEGTQNGQDKQITGAQLSNIDTLGKNKQAIIESTQALEKLANDGSRAANALAKVQAEQARFDKGVDSLFQAFTSNPLELLEMNFNTDALNRVLSGDNSGLKTAEGRRSALAGLEQDKDLLLPEEYRDKRAKLLEANFRATQNGPLTEKQQKVIDRVRTGDVDPNDPNVKAYREAVAVQEAAMDKLGKLQLDAALDVTNAMYTVADKFDDLPLLAKAIAAATNAQDEANNPRDRTLPIPKEEQERRNEAQRDIKAKKAAAKTAADIAESRKKKKDPKTKEFAKNAEVAAKLAKDSEQKELDRIASDDKKRAEQFATKNKEEKQAQIAQQTAKINVATQQQKAIASRRLSPSLTTRQKEIFEGITETTSVSQPKPQPRSQAVTQQEEIKIQEEAKKISTVDPLTLALSKQESQVVTKDLDALNLSRESKLEEIQKAERSAKAARVARAGRGDLNKEQRKTVTPQEEKLSLFQQDLASIDEQIKEKQNRQTELNKTISKANSPIAAVSAVSKSAQVTGTNIPTTQQSNVDSFVAQSNTEFTTDEQGVTRGEGGKVAFIEPQTSTATSNTQQRSSLVTAPTPNPQTYAQRKETERSSRKASYQSGKKAKRAAYVSSLNPGQRKAFDSKEKEKQSANQRAIDRLSAIPEEKRTVSQKKALEERQSQAVAYNKAQVEKNAPQVAQGYAKAKQIGSAISGFFGGGQTANTQVASGSTIARLKEKTTGVEALRPTLINGERTSAPVNPIATAQATQASGVTTTTVPSTPQEGTYSPADTPKQEGKKASSNLEGNMLIISPDSLQSLQGVFDSFNGYIENLKSWVPPDLKFTGSFKVDIDVKGMTSGLTEDGVKKLITEAITPIETQIKNGMLGPKFKTSGEKGSTKE